MSRRNFDRIAPLYRGLELLAFGRALERARSAHLAHLRGRPEILLLGDGDGRTLAQVLEIAPASRVISIDASRAMLQLAARRVGDEDRARVVFRCEDLRTSLLPPASCDAVVTQCFLDCFCHEEAVALVARIAAALRPGGVWLFADFTIPERGLQRQVARVVVGGLYWFFHWTTGISARSLPPAEREISRHGLYPVAAATFAMGMLRSVAFAKPGSSGGQQ